MQINELSFVLNLHLCSMCYLQYFSAYFRRQLSLFAFTIQGLIDVGMLACLLPAQQLQCLVAISLVFQHLVRSS